jgi:hypothetical protein
LAQIQLTIITDIARIAIPLAQTICIVSMFIDLLAMAALWLPSRFAGFNLV